MQLLDRASEVDWVVAPGTDLATSVASVDLAERLPGRVLATAGLHPHDAETWQDQRSGIEELAQGVAAIGETGLDFYRNLADRDAQVESLNGHISLAVSHDKPLIVHCRDAFGEVHSILEETGAGPRTVLHCWTGGRRWTRRFLELGVMFSFAGPIAFETGETVRLGAALVPQHRALVETDTPYLAPPPHRGEPNEPAWVARNGEALAAVWGMDPVDVARITTENATRVFRR